MSQAGIYCRISRDPEGQRVGVERQEEDCRRLAAREGLQVVSSAFIDNDISASTLSKKPRPAFAELLTAARDGRVSVIIAYSNSRLTRRPLELEDLIKLHDLYGTRIVTVVSGEDNLSTADGRMVARIKASVDAAEAERAGERIARAHLQKARQGSVNHGSRPFGWQDDKSSLHPTEARLVRKAAEDVIAGVGLLEICRRWNAAGVRTVRGNEWDHRSLRKLLKGPRLAGWRVHQGVVARDAAGREVRGVWEPILTQDDYDSLQAALSGRSGRSGGRRGARRYLLSGVVRCGRCGHRMYGTTTAKGHAYTCRGGQGSDNSHTISIAGAATDEVVAEVVAARLRQAGALEVPKRTFAQSERLSTIPEKISELMEAYNRGQLSGAIVFPQVEALESEQAELSAERQRFVASSAGPTHISAEAFDVPDIDRRRAIVESLFEAIVIAPSAKGTPWTPDRISYVWRQS
jgi:site-specific DNA recombinase